MATKRVLFISTFRVETNVVYALVGQAAALVGAVATRVDTMTSAHDPLHNVHSALSSADAIVCDLTNSDSATILELGAAWSFGKPVILLATHPEHIPFNLQSSVVVIYDLSATGRPNLVASLQRYLHQALDSPSGLTDVAHSTGLHGRVFISYSHKDREYLERLLVHLRPLERQGAIELFVDTRIKAGDRWKETIQAALRRARVAILLVSADFLASDFILDNELPPLLERAEKDGTRIIPLILKPCRFLRDPHLRAFQALNDPNAPLVLLQEYASERIYDQLAHLLEELLPAR